MVRFTCKKTNPLLPHGKQSGRGENEVTQKTATGEFIGAEAQRLLGGRSDNMYGSSQAHGWHKPLKCSATERQAVQTHSAVPQKKRSGNLLP